MFCPVLKAWFHPGQMVVAHFIPHYFGYGHVGCLMDEPKKKGYCHIWSTQNGLLKHRSVKTAFDKGRMGNSQNSKRWVVRLVNYTLMTKGSFAKYIGDGINNWRSISWADLDVPELDFLAKIRPSRRYLCAHYVTTLLRAYRARNPGWQMAMEERKSRKVWASPGKWYRSSTFKFFIL